MPNELNAIHQEIGELKASYRAMHTRQDNTEKNIEKNLDSIELKLDNLIAKENRRMGFTAAMVLVGTVIGWFLDKIF